MQLQIWRGYWRERAWSWISQDLKASQQCLQVYSKANKVLGVLNRTVKYKDTANLLCFYKPLIRPHLKFCTSVWSPYCEKDKQLIEKIQRRFTKMIPDLKLVPYSEIGQTEIMVIQRTKNQSVSRSKLVYIIIPAKAFARDYGITGVRLSVCLFVTTITK